MSQPNPISPVGTRWYTVHSSVIAVETVWWRTDQLYAYTGAKTAAQKRTVRRLLDNLLQGRGAYRTAKGTWYVAEIVARTYFADYHDDALKRAITRAQGGQRADTRTFRPRLIPQTA